MLSHEEGKIVDMLMDTFFLIKKLDSERKENMAEILEVMCNRTFEKREERKEPYGLVV